MENPTIQYLHECFALDVDKGVLRWKKRPFEHFPSEKEQKRFNSRLSGAIAGHQNRDGRKYIVVDGKKYLAYRLIYALHHAIPLRDLPDLIDHKDGNTLNDRPRNLRAATPTQNNANQRLSSTNSSGFKGVCWSKRSRKWQASIKVSGVNLYLGLFDDPHEAHRAYLAAAKIHFGEFARAA